MKYIMQYVKLSTKISLKRKSFLKSVKYILHFIAVMTALIREKSSTITTPHNLVEARFLQSRDCTISV